MIKISFRTRLSAFSVWRRIWHLPIVLVQWQWIIVLKCSYAFDVQSIIVLLLNLLLSWRSRCLRHRDIFHSLTVNKTTTTFELIGPSPSQFVTFVLLTSIITTRGSEIHNDCCRTYFVVYFVWWGNGIMLSCLPESKSVI